MIISINDSWFWGIQKDIGTVTHDMCPNASNQRFWPFRNVNACSALESSWWLDDTCLLEWTAHFYPWNEAHISSWIDSDTICTSKDLKKYWSVVHGKINKVLKVKNGIKTVLFSAELHAEIFQNEVEPIFRKRFCKDISPLMVCVNKF